MIIALPNDILFDSGRTDVKPDGTIALAKVAQVLASVPDRSFVAGHTDNVPTRTGAVSVELGALDETRGGGRAHPGRTGHEPEDACRGRLW